jgi:hypothetical protein
LQLSPFQKRVFQKRCNQGFSVLFVRQLAYNGKSFKGNVSLVIKGKKSPFYIANFCIDSKEGNIKGFNLNANGGYLTWIGVWTTEKKFSIDVVQNFKPETVSGKAELFYETSTNMTFTSFNSDGTKTGENKFNKVK